MPYPHATSIESQQLFFNAGILSIHNNFKFIFAARNVISPNKITDLLLEHLRQRPVYVNVHGEIKVFGYCVKERLRLLFALLLDY